MPCKQQSNIPTGQEQDATRGGGRGKGKLMDVRQRCHMRQRGNQPGGTRGEQEVELPGQCEVATRQEVAVLTREARQRQYKEMQRDS